MNQISLIILNGLTGLFVAFSSVTGFLFSDISESEDASNDMNLFIWLLTWAIGLGLQFNKKTKVFVIFFSLIPVVFF
ncbi:MAG TPA: hypothetical protein VEY70_06520 [Metabacillus sp.]|nr:hypothetical protein [Metabacillus sp.]